MLPDKDKCVVFHGTNLFTAKIIQYHGIWLDVQRKLTDFGKGFYVTLNSKQAKSWARVKAMNPQIHPRILKRLKMTKDQYFNCSDTRTPAYLAFELDLNKLRQLNGKIFPLPHEPRWAEYQQTWEMFVQKCRSGEKHHYDYVYGPIGGSHPSDPNKFTFSETKEQLSLNTEASIRCLTNLMVLTMKPEKKHDEKTTLNQRFKHSKYDADFRDNDHHFWNEIRNKVMSIGHLTGTQADQIHIQILVSLAI
mgnify:CR=1 FL=1